MSSRVDEQNAQAAAEAERLAQKADKNAREAKTSEASRQAFSKLVRAQEQGTRETKGKAEQGHAESKQGEAQAQKNSKGAESADRAARMARGGVVQHARVMEQAKSFSQVLGNQTASTQQSDGQRVERRDSGVKKDRVERDDRERDVQRVESRRDAEQEQARVEARDQGRPNAAIDGNGRGKGDGRNDGRGDEGAAAIAALKKASNAPTPASGPQGAAGARQIPPEILEKLVSTVYLAVNQKGLKEFQIELKDGPLKGTTMKLSAADGKISLSFIGLEADQRRLVEASKGDLMRRLEKKGLKLARLDVK